MLKLKYEDMTPEQWAPFKYCLWGPPEQERYVSYDPDEAIGEIIYYGLPGTPLPTTVEIVAMRSKVVELDAEDLLDSIMDDIDEEFSDPEGVAPPADHTPNMIAKAKELAAVIAAEYKPWACEYVLHVTVTDVPKWVRENAPELLNSDDC